MSTKRLKKNLVAGIPLIISVFKRLELKSILSEYIPSYGNEKFPIVDTLLLLLCNLTLGRQPLYELEQWIRGINTECFGLDAELIEVLNDDRFARALDKLHLAAWASLMTHIVLEMIKRLELNLSRIHNDSTTLKAYGKIPGKTRNGLKLAKGNSKDHRPDLKQLVFTLSICADGAVPIHFKTYSGNRTDDTTHIETWNTLCELTGCTDFIYVADCKVCTSKQLSHIVSSGGRVITVMPKTWKAYTHFINDQRLTTKKKSRIWRRLIPGKTNEYESFYVFDGEYTTEKGTIYWIYSTEKAKMDLLNREKRLEKAHRDLLNLLPRLNKRKLKTEQAIKEAVEGILKKHNVEDFFDYVISERYEEYKKKVGRGRPGPNVEYITITDCYHALSWELDKETLKKERNVDGLFPLLTTDKSLSALQVLKYYKYQPKLEKRFNQLKSVHEAAPLLFKKIERVEAIMFLFFLALMVQAIIEREVRLKMKERGIESLPIYPEFRDSFSPTTSKILYTFEDVFSYEILEEENVIEKYRDALTPTQQIILELLNIPLTDYWADKS